jgi:hypothetical protein
VGIHKSPKVHEQNKNTQPQFTRHNEKTKPNQTKHRSINANMATSIYELKAAAHLNNTAITLILSRSYLTGMKTLSDAVSIIKDASSRQARTQAGSQAHVAQVLPWMDTSFAAIQERLRKAGERLSNQEPFPVNKNTHIAVLSDEERPTFSLSKVKHLIRMDSFGFEDVLSENDLEVATSIIFYNYAIAYRCLSSLSTASMPNAKEHDSRALRLLHLAYSASRNSALQFNRSQLVNLLVLHNLVELSHQQGLDEGRQHEYATRLGYLRHIIYKMEAIEGQLLARPARAA